jgi:molybdopterin/thiamine biosynthesis adenylyltransferase
MEDPGTRFGSSMGTPLDKGSRPDGGVPVHGPGRYQRQVVLPEWGAEGQAALRAGHAMIIGCGALGCPAADLLARAGVGRLTLVDRDVVDPSNLHRQTLYTEEDASQGLPKAEAAARRLRGVNREIRVEAEVEDVTPEVVERLLGVHPRPGVVLDCTDNFQTRYLLNDACVKLAIPLVYAGALRTGGVQMTMVPPGVGVEPTACLRCVFPEPPAVSEACETAGIYAPLTVLLGALQASDTLKILMGRWDRLSRSLLSLDLWSHRRQTLDLTSARAADCPACVRRRFEFLDGGWSGPVVLCARAGRPGAVQLPSPGRAVDLPSLAERLSAYGTFAVGAGVVRGELQTPEARVHLTVFADGRAIIAGTTDPAAARSIYARFVGA